jgi:hypothetical protein
LGCLSRRRLWLKLGLGLGLRLALGIGLGLRFGFWLGIRLLTLRDDLRAAGTSGEDFFFFALFIPTPFWRFPPFGDNGRYLRDGAAKR